MVEVEDADQDAHCILISILNQRRRAIESIDILLYRLTQLPYKSHAHPLPCLHSPAYPYTQHTGTSSYLASSNPRAMRSS